MRSYLLKRQDKVTGPFSLKELKGIGLLSSDSVRIEGKSVVWQFADEIKELVSFVSYASALDQAPKGLPDVEFYQRKDGRQDETVGNIRNPDYPSAILSENEISENVSKGFQSEPIKVIIADDHTLFREGVKMALSTKKDVIIIGEVENGLQLLHFLKHNVPDVILLDIQMPLMDGITALTTIRNNNSNIKVIMLSMYNDHSMVSTLMEAGANAYLTKTADSEIIYDAIKTVHIKSYYFNELTNISLLEKIRSKKIVENSRKIKPETLVLFAGNPILTNRPYPSTARKSVKQLIVVTCSILVISSGILAGITILNHSNRKPVITRQNYETRVSDVPLNTKTVPGPNSIAPATIGKIPGNNLPSRSVSSINEIANPEMQKSSQGRYKNTARKLIPGVNVYNTKYVSSKQISTFKTVDRKEMTLKKLHSLVTVHMDTPHTVANGISSGTGLTVFNQTLYTLDRVMVDVQYILKDSVIYKKKTLNFIGITPLSSRMISIPNAAPGTRIEFRIISVKSGELNL